MSAPLNDGTPVVILGVHYGSLGIARSLGRLGIPVHGIHDELRTSAFSSRYFAQRHEWNFARMPAAKSVAFLLQVRSRLGRDAVLIPTTDGTAQLLADHADELRGGYRFQQNPPDLIRRLRNKWELSGLATRHGVPSPRTLLPVTAREALEGAREIGYPLMLKGSDGALLEARALRKMIVVRTPDELSANYARMQDPSGPNLMLQEYIPGRDDSVWMFNGYFDRKSACIAGFTGKKIRQHPVHTGATSLGICLRNDAVRELTTAFMGALGYQGIIDIGYRYDARDGRYKVLDVNPRIGATFRLFVGADGTDVARLLYLDLTGRPPPTTALVEGRKWLDEHRDFYAAREYRREDSLTIREWLSSLRGVQETAWFARDDLRPAARQIADFAGRGIQRAWRALVRPFRAAR